MQRNKTILVKNIKEYSFLDSQYLELTGGFYELPFAIEPTEGAHSLKSCENCRKHHKLLVKDIQKDFENFPNCCELHSKLNDLEIFNKEDYLGLPKMIADKVFFTYHHIINNLDNDDWYEDVSDYLVYNFESFGSLPDGFGEPFKWSSYLKALKHLLLNIENEISSDIISVVELKTRMKKTLNLLEPVLLNKEASITDFNLLLSKYNDWYKIFPFELPYFEHLKEKFKKTLPIYTGRIRHNKYLKTTKREIHTKDSFAVVLLRITQNIIGSINGLQLYQEGLISNHEKHQVDLIINNRKLELYELSNLPNSKKAEYIKVLKRWFRQEKKFINEITPFLENKKNVNSTTSRPNRTDIAYYIYYMSSTKLLKLDYHFPSDKAWEEIGKEFNKNSKNIQQVYNIISSKFDERIKKTKIKNIEFVINEMLDKSSLKAISLAKDELKLAQLKS